MNHTTPFLPGLSPVCGKEIVARFDGGRLSSDGGVLLLREVEARLGIADLLAARLPDSRDPDRLTHCLADMIRDSPTTSPNSPILPSAAGADQRS